MKNSEIEEIAFIKIWNEALENANAKSDFNSDDQSFVVGDILVCDKRKKFSKWLVRTGRGEAPYYTSGVIVTRQGGGYHWDTAYAYAQGFCEILKKYGIECYNQVQLD